MMIAFYLYRFVDGHKSEFLWEGLPPNSAFSFFIYAVNSVDVGPLGIGMKVKTPGVCNPDKGRYDVLLFWFIFLRVSSKVNRLNVF